MGFTKGKMLIPFMKHNSHVTTHIFQVSSECQVGHYEDAHLKKNDIPFKVVQLFCEFALRGSVNTNKTIFILTTGTVHLSWKSPTSIMLHG